MELAFLVEKLFLKPSFQVKKTCKFFSKSQQITILTQQSQHKKSQASRPVLEQFKMQKTVEIFMLKNNNL